MKTLRSVPLMLMGALILYTIAVAQEPSGGLLRDLVFFQDTINDSLRYHPYTCSGPTIISTPVHGGTRSMEFVSGSEYAGFQVFWAGNTNPGDWWGADTSVFWAHSDSHLTFWIYSSTSGNVIGVSAYGFYTWYGGVGSATISSQNSWQQIDLPIPANLLNLPLKGFEVNFGNATPTTDIDDFVINDVRMYAGTGTPPPANFSYIAASQLGYAPQMKKIFSSPGDFTSFTLVRTSDNSVVYTGSGSSRSVSSSVIGNSTVYIGDFSSFTVPGRYKIVANGKESLPFNINQNVFDGAVRAAQRSFYYQRSFTAIASPYAEGPWMHPTDIDKAPAGVVKGWHDAGDLTIYMPTQTQAIWWLLESWMDLQPASDSTNIPESGNGVPDILDEARWGLEWVLSMQDLNGGFWGNACAGGTNSYPYGSTTPNTVGNYVKTIAPTTQNTAKAIAVLAYASKVYQQFDAAFASRCLTAAQAGWSWMSANPNSTNDADVGACSVYAQGNDAALLQTNEMWAAAAMLYATGSSTYETAFESFYTPISWISSYSKSDAFAGKIYLRCTTNANVSTQNAIKQSILYFADGVRTDGDAHPFGWATFYYWGSNSNAAHRTGQFSWEAYRMDTTRVADRDQLLNNVHYFFGRNDMNLSYMSGSDAFGATQWRKEGFHHWMKALQATPFHFPGAFGGGPNDSPSNNDVSYPSATPYPVYGYFGDPRYPRDGTTVTDGRFTDNDSWSTNEIAVSWQSAILYNLLAAQFVARGGSFVSPPDIVITSSGTSGGTISPSGALTVVRNSDKTFTITPDPGYMVASLLVDGVEQGHLTSYTFSNITANHTIAVTFMLIPTEVYVDASYTPGSAGGHTFGYDGFNTIQPTIDIVAVGGKVHVAAGTYNETVALNKSTNLLGAGSATTTINAGGSLNDGVTISASGVTMSGFTVTISQNGVMVVADKATIKSCAFTSYSQNGVKVLNKDYAFIQNNHFTGAAGTSGILLSGAQQCAVSGNAIIGNNVNVMVVASTSPVRSARNNNIRSNTLLNPVQWSVVSDPVLNKVNFNVFSTAGTFNKYVQNTSATVVLNAEYNWFGGENPPNGSDFSGNVDTTHYFATNPTIFIDPMSHYIPVGSPVMVTVSGMLPAGTYAKGSSVTLNWSNDASMPDVTVPVDGGFFDDGVGPVFFAFNPLTGSSVKVDQSLLNNTPPGGVGEPALFPYPYIGDLFSMTFQPGGAGASTLTLSSTLLRSSDNSPLPVDIGPAAVLTADAAIPTVANVMIHNQTLNTDDPTVNGTGQDDYIKNGDAVRITADIDDDNPLTSADMVADLTPFGGTSGVSATSFDDNTHHAYWDFSPLSGTGNTTLTIPVSVTDVVYNLATASDNIVADNTAPNPPTDFKAFTPIGTSGNGKVSLTWTVGTDPFGTYKGMVPKYVTRTYPAYTNDPAYPPDAGQGTAVDGSPFVGTSATHTIADRAIYKYTAFSLDWAGNYSTVVGAAQQDLSANYFPGDLGSGPNPYPGTAYDGRVNFDDLVWFSNFYFANSPFVNNGGEVDFGPTSSNKTYGANHRLGIPTPDGHVDFEDLMIFSMNYLNTTPKITEPSDRQLAQTFAVELYNTRSTTQQGEMLTVTLHLANDGRQVKGCSVELSFDPLLLQYVDASPGGLFGSSQQGFFYAQSEQNKVRVDASVLGVDRTVDFSGNIAVVRFRVLQAGQGQAMIANATVRNGDNNSQQPVLNSNAVPLPTVFSLAQNYPNPFNPSTTINYQIPSTTLVTVEVYNVLGERVATLVNELKGAGYYNVVWNGRNSANQQVASGLYIYTMRAGDFRNVKKMILLK